MQLQRLALSANWQYKLYTDDSPLPHAFSTPHGWQSARVPGTIHQDLLAAQCIPNPFEGLNEEAVQWIGERAWLYRCTFEMPPEWAEMPPEWAEMSRVMLCSDGLDTFATVWLNETPILQSENMFLTHHIPVQSLLRVGENTLCILFKSAWQIGKELEETHGKLVKQSWVGDSSRFYVRKAQYHYGWDWGPKLLTAGIWRPMYLEAFSARIADLSCPIALSDDLQSADLAMQVELENENSADLTEMQLALTVYAPSGQKVVATTLPVNATTLTSRGTITQPQLWWPRGYGEQALYTLVATLSYPPPGFRLTPMATQPSFSLLVTRQEEPFWVR